MVRISVLHDALKTMYNAEKRGKRQVLIRPASKVVIKFLQLMMKHGYIGEFEFVDDHRAGKIVIHLNGRLNKCGCISPRYNVGHDVRPLLLAWLLAGPLCSSRCLHPGVCVPAELATTRSPVHRNCTLSSQRSQCKCAAPVPSFGSGR